MENIIIPNPERFEKLKKIFIEQGVQKLHVLTDFDRTLTHAYVEGLESATSFAQVRNGKYLSDEYTAEVKELFAKYRPIELDVSLSAEQKAPLMLEWWKKHFDALVKYGLDRKIIDEIAHSRDFRFRERAGEFLQLMNEKKIPVVIMSAGLGDVFVRNLEIENSLHENIFVITNLFEFNVDGKAQKIKEPIIHSMNKHEIVVPGFPIFEKIKDKKNVLLLGDVAEDVGMIDGFEYDNLIKIGFFNEGLAVDGDVHFEEFKKKFDVIITNDGSMDFVLDFCKEIN